MKNPFIVTILFFISAACSSCRSKAVVLLSKKWDCMQVENIIPPGTKSLSAQDSANLEKLNLVFQTINWTFKTNRHYECAIGDRITVQGKYQLMENDKVLICTPESASSTNRYHIKALNGDELVLEGYAENTRVLLHFRPH